MGKSSASCERPKTQNTDQRDETDHRGLSTDIDPRRLTKKIIKAFYKVYNELGCGFPEKVYGNAMEIELTAMAMKVEQQRNIKVYYNGIAIGDYFADLFADELVIVELNAAEFLCKEHEARLLNYLRATDIEVGLSLNFGKKAEFRRKIFTNDRKRRK